MSYRSNRSKTVSNWRTSVDGADVLAATERAVAALKRRQRRSLDIVGIYLHAQEEPQAATADTKGAAKPVKRRLRPARARAARSG